MTSEHHVNIADAIEAVVMFLESRREATGGDNGWARGYRPNEEAYLLDLLLATRLVSLER